MRQLRLKIKGAPAPKQSMKFTKTGFSYQPAKIKKEVVNIRAQVVNQLPENFEMFTGPLFLFAVFIFPEKKTHKAAERKILQAGGLVKKDTHPDCVNLMKQLEDSLQGVVFKNDSQIYCETIYKGYGKTPGVDIWIAEMDDMALDINKNGMFHLHFDEKKQLFTSFHGSLLPVEISGPGAIEINAFGEQEPNGYRLKVK